MNHLLTYDRKQDPEPVDPFPDPVVPVEDPKEDLEDNMAINLPPSLRSKGQHLYQKLKGTLQWNDKGEILTQDNRPIGGSHIADLINTGIRTKRKIRKLPADWGYFTQKLQEANIPERLLGRGLQFQPPEEVWKPEPESELESESEPEWESEWKPKIPRKKEQMGEYIKWKTSIDLLQYDEKDHEGLLSLFTKQYKAHR